MKSIILMLYMNDPMDLYCFSLVSDVSNNDFKSFIYVYSSPSGNSYWEYNGNSFTRDSPKPISDFGINKSIDHIDAVFIWGNSNFLLIIVNENMYLITNFREKSSYVSHVR